MVNYSNQIEFFNFESIDSTNDFLLKQPFNKKIQICIAKEQTQGKGQFNRKWLADKNTSILCSIKRNFPNISLNGLSLVVGLSIIKTLEKHYQIVGLKIKWPNDIYYKDKKLAGILLENIVQNQQQSLVIGFGVNINLAKDFSNDFDWIDLQRISKREIDIKKLTQEIIQQILLDCDYFVEVGWQGFIDKWQQYDYLKGQTKTIKNQTGIVQGVSSDGALIMNIDGKKQIFYSS
ncbi:Biotin operon repressor / Biotin-protein ligase [hydrothermal vent metagenome]|uniref:Biotin operon repressor / Biotin-protein ligase n=1 Tax=hydrothermal vent metagenome TaxID=652676 RepID=A0A1W1CG75_9ZZZZ